MLCAAAWLQVFTWHLLDIFITFFGVSLLSVYVLDIRPSEGGRALESRLLAALSVITGSLVYYDRFSVAINGVLWALPIGLLIVRFNFHPPPPPRHSAFSLHLTRAFVYLGLGLICFVCANFVFEYPKPRAATVPDTRYYWAFHSVWHIFSSLSVYSLLQTTPLPLASSEHFSKAL